MPILSHCYESHCCSLKVPPGRQTEKEKKVSPRVLSNTCSEEDNCAIPRWARRHLSGPWVKAEQGGHTESRRLGVGAGMCGLVGVSTCTCAERERRELEWEEVGWGT